MKTIIFVDFWNFQLNWNTRIPNDKVDWIELPNLFIERAQGIVKKRIPNKIIEFDEFRIYASIKRPTDNKLREFLLNKLNTQPGFKVIIKQRRSRPIKVFCKECKTEFTHCPKCNTKFYSASEKGVDAAIITDMFALHMDKRYDMAILVTADSDLVPMVEYLQEHGIKVINASWENHGYDIRQASWASFKIDDLTGQLSLPYIE